MARKILGDPRKTAQAVASKELESSKSTIDEALAHGLRLLEQAYEKALREAESKLRSEISRAEEQLKSIASSLELDLRSEAARLKTRYLEEALSRALERIGEIKASKAYENYLVRVLSRLSGEEYDQLVVKVAEDDRDRVQALISRLGLRNLVVSPEPAKILGGIVAETPDGSTRLDFSLDLIVEMNKHRLLGTASRVLFPTL